jgi:hypothetical protein
MNFRMEIMFILNFDNFPCSRIRIRIRIPNTDPDPGEQNQCGSGVKSGSSTPIITYVKRFAHVKILLFVTAKSHLDPDPHWVGPWIRIRFRTEVKSGDPDPH